MANLTMLAGGVRCYVILRNQGLGLKSGFLLFVCGSVLALAQEPVTPAPDQSTSPTPAVPAASSSDIVLDPNQPDPPPADWHGRLEVYLKSLVGPQVVFEVLPEAVWDHARKFPKEWGSHGIGFADRLGSEYAQFILSQTIQLGFAAIHKEDPRYFRVGQGNFFRRTGHAIRGAVIVSNTKGGETLAVGEIAGAFGSWAIASQWWEPRSEQSFGHVMLWGGVPLATKAGTNILREFWPDAKRKFFTHHSKSTPVPHQSFTP